MAWALLARSLGTSEDVRGRTFLTGVPAGALSGNIAYERSPNSLMCSNRATPSVIQSILGEITDATNEAQAMPLTSITWNIGCVIGPMLGGTLSTPAEQYPNSLIARVRLFQDYPYVRRSLLYQSYSPYSHY